MNKAILKRLAFLLAFVLVLMNVSFALAESVDLASMTDDEILELLANVNAEIVSRGLPKSATLPQGSYIVGEDIPAGSYIYTCLAEDNDWGNFTVYSERGDGSLLEWEIVSAPDEGEEPDTFFLKLAENDKLTSPTSFSLTISGGVLFQ